MSLKIEVWIHSRRALRYKYTLCVLIINVKHEYAFSSILDRRYFTQYNFQTLKYIYNLWGSWRFCVYVVHWDRHISFKAWCRATTCLAGSEWGETGDSQWQHCVQCKRRPQSLPCWTLLLFHHAGALLALLAPLATRYWGFIQFTKRACIVFNWEFNVSHLYAQISWYLWMS